MKKRSAGEILFTLRHAGIEEYKSQICAKASFLSGKKAFFLLSFMDHWLVR